MGTELTIFTLLCVYFFGISRQDVQRREISNCAPVVLILASPFVSTVPLPESILGLFGLLIPLASVSIITNGFGMGDVKLCAAFGWTLGAFTAYCALAAALTAAVLAGKITHQKRLPLAPFLCGAGLVTILLMGEINCAIEPAGDSNKPIPMHIMTNKYQINGASVLLYHGLLDGLAEKLGTDLYVIPSSIHELIIMPAEDGSLSLSKLSDMVKEINENHVKEEEILSDCAYYYDHKEKSFYM